MNREIPIIIVWPLLAAAAVVVFLLGVTAYKRALNTSRHNAALIFLFCLAASAASMFYRDSQRSHGGDPWRLEPLWMILAAGLLPLFLIPFLINLYQRWIGNRMSDTQRAPSMDGIRAWLSGGNLFCALLIATFASIGYNYSFWGVLALTIMALFAYPILNMASTSFQPAPAKTDVPSPERERVLRMLDEGKINAEETAELLNALGYSGQPPRPAVSTAASPHRKMVLIGLVLLVIGFFLPWFTIDLSLDDQFSRMFPGLRERMEEIANQHPGTPVKWPTVGSFHYSAGDIRFGLGWIILLLGIAAAALPYVADHVAPDVQHKARLILLGLGSILLIFVLTDSLRFASIGILLGLVGYALQWIGTLKERQVISK